MSRKKRLLIAVGFLASNVLTYYATPYINACIDLWHLERQLASATQSGQYSFVDFEQEPDVQSPQENFHMERDTDIYVIVSIPDHRLGQDSEKNRLLAEQYLFLKDEVSFAYNGMKLMLDRHNYGWHPMIKVRKE